MRFQIIVVLVVASFGFVAYRLQADEERIQQTVAAEVMKPGQPNQKVIDHAAAEASALGRAYGSIFTTN